MTAACLLAWPTFETLEHTAAWLQQTEARDGKNSLGAFCMIMSYYYSAFFNLDKVIIFRELQNHLVINFLGDILLVSYLRTPHHMGTAFYLAENCTRDKMMPQKSTPVLLAVSHTGTQQQYWSVLSKNIKHSDEARLFVFCLLDF